VTHARAATLVVDVAGGGDFDDVQSALDAAAGGDTVLVGAGEYVLEAPLDFNRLHDPDDPGAVPVKDLVLRAESGADATTLRLSADVVGLRVASVIVFTKGETEASTVEGFTITGGRGFAGRGGGLFIEHSSPRIVDCTIAGNTATGNAGESGGEAAGGGVWMFDSDSDFERCRVVDNTVRGGQGSFGGGGAPMGVGGEARGGGVFADWGGSQWIECVIEGNAAIGGSAGFGNRAVGGGAFVGSGWARFDRCRIVGNRAIGGGGDIGGDASGGGAAIIGRFSDPGGVLRFLDQLHLRNCVIARNRAQGQAGGGLGGEGRGGGVFNDEATTYIAFATIAGNHTADAPGFERPAVATDGAPVYVEGSIVWANAGGSLSSQDQTIYVRGSCVAGFESFEVLGNIDADPHFAGDDDFRLQPGSPCIDVAISRTSPLPDVDIDGHERPCGAGFDMGAHEVCPGNDAFVRGDADARGNIDLTDGIRILNWLFLGIASPGCVDAADVDRSRTVDVTDAVYLFNYLFLGGPEPPGPHPDCGVDRSPEALGCRDFAPCPPD